MRKTILGFYLALCVGTCSAQSPEPPLDDMRLTIHSLVREDIFAGFRANNMERLSRGEKNVEQLLQERPEAKAGLLAWKGGATLYRAVLALEANDRAQYDRLYHDAVADFTEARKTGPQDGGAAAVVGGSYVLFTDRLAEEHQDAGWQACYDSYKVLWGQQKDAIKHLPRHIGGELLAGMAQSSQRLGRDEELVTYLDKMIEVFPNTQYSRMASAWKADPAAAVGANISCKGCHAEGRLSARIAALPPN